MRILIVEDHPETLRLLERTVREAGYRADGAEDARTAREHLARGRYGVMVLDLMLPDGSGLDICREMRSAGNTTPVLVLTARGEVGDRVAGLDAGADDYLRKPFAVAELLARIRALERRGPLPKVAAIQVGALEVRLAERRVLLEGREIPLTAREFSILEILVRRRGHVVRRADILEEIWGEETSSAAGSLEVLVSRLRRKLSGAGRDGLLRTHRGVGYSMGLAI